MEKEFVPRQPSLNMKELGFDEPCFEFYNDMENNKPNKYPIVTDIPNF